MILKLRLFATLKERVGAPQLEVSLPPAATVDDLLAEVARGYPSLQPALEVVIVAVNREFADPSHPLTPDDEVVLFPPVSGG